MVRIVSRLSEAEKLSHVENIFHPAGKGLSSEEIDVQLIEVCLNFPDPGGAMDLILEAPRGSTAAQVVAAALAMAPRSVSTWSSDELDPSHPLRHWKLAG